MSVNIVIVEQKDVVRGGIWKLSTKKRISNQLQMVKPAYKVTTRVNIQEPGLVFEIEF